MRLAMLGVGWLALVACGEEPPEPTVPAPAPVEAPAPEPAPAPVESGEDFWCCEYDGPLGKTQALIDNPAECKTKFGDHGGQFVRADRCEPVCCEYAIDPADLGKGYQHAVVAAGNCAMRKGQTTEPTPETCVDLVPESERPKVRKPARPKPRGPMVRPGSRPRPAPHKGGGLVRPGG